MLAVRNVENRRGWRKGVVIPLRYNSRLPLAVFVPEGVEVRYRIWKADPEFQSMPQG